MSASILTEHFDFEEIDLASLRPMLRVLNSVNSKPLAAMLHKYLLSCTLDLQLDKLLHVPQPRLGKFTVGKAPSRLSRSLSHS
jgi:hypothetical protein